MSDTNTQLGLAPITHIKAQLDRIYGPNIWHEWEPETISHDLGIVLDELALDKIAVLQIMENDPHRFYTDMYFFIHAVNVMNNHVTDFEHLPHPTSLELAWALTEAKKMAPAEVYMDEIVDVVTYFLREEGYSEPVAPFEFVPKQRLEAGQEPADTDAKRRAILVYCKGMNEL